MITINNKVTINLVNDRSCKCVCRWVKIKQQNSILLFSSVATASSQDAECVQIIKIIIQKAEWEVKCFNLEMLNYYPFLWKREMKPMAFGFPKSPSDKFQQQFPFLQCYWGCINRAAHSLGHVNLRMLSRNWRLSREEQSKWLRVSGDSFIKKIR